MNERIPDAEGAEENPGTDPAGQPTPSARSPSGASVRSTSSPLQPADAEPPSGLRGRLFRLTLKELREILRDRRTIITLVLMPLLVYPVLGVVFLKFVPTLHPSQAIYIVGVSDRGDEHALSSFFSRAGEHLRNLREAGARAQQSEFNGPAPLEFVMADDDDRTLEELVSDGSINLGLRTRRLDPLSLGDQRFPRLHVELVYQRNSPSSLAAVEYLQSRLNAWEDYVRMQVRNSEQVLSGITSGTAAQTAFVIDAAKSQIVSTRFVNVVDRSFISPGVTLASVIPLILILMTITGAVYPAIDLTAGERERGTLEALVAAPLPRLALLFGKYVAVVTVAMLTAIVNLVAMSATAKTVGLTLVLFGKGGLSFATIATVFGLLMLFAVFFSAVLLAVTSFARSFKEAQAYLIPLMLLSLAPGVMSLVPGVHLEGPLAVAPLVNMVLLARDVFAGEPHAGYAVIAILSTALYAAASLALAARIFGTDAILYGSYGTWGELLRRPTASSERATIPMAMFCLAALFPLFFMAGGLLRGDGTWSVSRQMALSAILTALLFGGLPLSMALWRRLRLETAFALRQSPSLGYVAAVILGLTLWPAAHEVVWLSKQIGLASLDGNVIANLKNLVGVWASINPVILLLALAVAPAIFEELCFRGFVFQALLGKLSPWQAIFASAALFGIFHVVISGVLATERLLPSTFMGVGLAYLAWRTGSVFPGMVLHMLHNALIPLVLQYQSGRFGRVPALDAALEWLGLTAAVSEVEVSHLPVACLVLGVVGPIVGFWLASRLRPLRASESSVTPSHDEA